MCQEVPIRRPAHAMKMVSSFRLCLVLSCARLCMGVDVRKSWASSESRNGRLEGVVLKTLNTPIAGTCLAACRSEGTCTAFNHQHSTGTCELLSTRLCDDDTSALSLGDPSWRYYDFLDDQGQGSGLLSMRVLQGCV
ncbi:uncharacterized protein LOC122249780 [Penaeus japonicus]|uniref:uncharacterized protein LOC122249780 n=1 Tax=Penaeus japonicus TaxID=27405 RepID=UPI001C70E955|nr:uncharacterized protein LOC122249780 [Penaeus japonicus]